MRNLKKLLAVVVAFCVLATMSLSAFAAETTAPAIGADAQICKDLGVLKGDTADGVTATYLAKGTTRLQAAQLYLRLIGKEADALAFAGTDNFADATGVWAGGQKVMAYLKANPTLGWQGIGNDKFDPNGAATAQMIYKVALEALGYKTGTDFQYADTITFGAGKGLSKIAAVTTLTNDSTASALVEVLKATLKDGSKTLAADLVAKNVITAAAATAAGLTITAPKALDVSTVEAVGPTTVKIALGTAAVAADVAGASFAIKDDAGKALEVKGAELYAEKDVRITTAVTTATKYTLTYNGTNYDYVGLPAETDKPEVNAVAIPKTKNWVELTFNERLDKATATNVANYSINNSLTVSAAELKGDDKVVKLTTSDQTAGKLYTVTVSNVKDLAGNVINSDKDEAKFGGVVDTTKPKVSAAAVPTSNVKVKVYFDSEMDEASVENIANYAIDNGLTVTAADYDNDNKLVTLTTSAQTAGKLYKVTVSNVKDLSGNVVDSDNDEAKFGGVAIPSDGPKAKNPAIALSNTSVEVDFTMGMSELDKATAENVANYSINDLTVTKAVLQDDKASVKLTTSAQTAGKLYTITMTGITNNFGKVINSDNDEVKFGGLKLDTEGPEVKSASAFKEGDDYFVNVLFNKKVDEKSAEVAANYYFGTSLGYAKSAALQDDGVTVKVKTGTQNFNVLYTLAVSNVKSVDGVVVKSDKDEAKFAGVGSAAKPEVDYAIAKNKMTIVVYFKTNLTADNDTDAGATNAANFANYHLWLGSTEKTIITDARYNDTDKSVTLYLSDALEAGKMYTVKVDDTVTSAGDATQSDADKLKADFAGIDTSADFTVDYVMAVNNKTIDVYFTDELDPANLPDEANTFIKGGTAGKDDQLFVDNAVTNDAGATVDQLSSNKKVLRITLDDASLISGKVYELYFKEAGLDTVIKSIGGFGIKEDTSDKSVVASFAGANDTLAKAGIDYLMATDSKTIKLVFKSTVTNFNDGQKGNVEVTTATTTDAYNAGITPAAIYPIADTDGKEYNLYFNTDMTSGRVYKVVIDGAAALANAAGAQSDDIDSSVAGSPDEHAAPKIVSATVNSARTQIKVKLNQKVTSIDQNGGVGGVQCPADDMFKFSSGTTFENGTPAQFPTTDVNITDKDEITITLDSPLAGSQSPKIGFLTPDMLKDRTGENNGTTATDDMIQFVVPVDIDAPVLTLDSAGAITTVVLSVNEDLAYADGANLKAYFALAKASGAAVTGGSITTAAYDKDLDTITFTIVAGDIDAGGHLKVLSTLKDVAGNGAAAANVATVSAGAADWE